MNALTSWEPDYADAELRALRIQEDRIRSQREAERRRKLCEAEKAERRKRIMELGEEPCA
jgi:hypothetical protein